MYDKCVYDKLGVERPDPGYFCEIKVHDSARPKPKDEGPAIYPDATPAIPDDYPRTRANYGTRYVYLN